MTRVGMLALLVAAVLAVYAWLARMTVAEYMALLVVVVATPLIWAEALRLVRLARARPDLRTVKAHAVAAVGLAIIVTVFAVVFVNNGMDDPFFTTAETQLITRGTLLIFTVGPALYWRRLTLKLQEASHDR